MPQSIERLGRIVIRPIFFAVLLYLVHFVHCAQFGVYEDDWARIPRVADGQWHTLLPLLRGCLQPNIAQGRPLHPAFVYFFSWLGYCLHGLVGLYWIGWGIQTINALLFYRLVGKVFPGGAYAFLATAGFCLFPADTTQPFLTHALGAQTAITLLLLAFLSYVRGWRVLSYVVCGLILFNYETPFLLFAAAPLLTDAWREKKALLRHGAAMGFLLLISFVYRALAAEDRVAHMGARQVLLGLTNTVSGPVTVLVMYVYHPLQALTRLGAKEWGVALLCAAGVFCLMPRAAAARAHAVVPLPRVAQVRWMEKRVALGLITLVLAYPLTMTTLGFSIAGRGTRAHLAAVFGASLLFGYLAEWLFMHGRGAMRALAALWVLLLAAFALSVQLDYVTGWAEERSFWRELLSTCPSLQDGDVVLVEPSRLRDTRQLLFLRRRLNGVPETRQIKSLDHMVLVLPRLLEMPCDWKQPPAVFRMPPGWQRSLFDATGKIPLQTIEAPAIYDPHSRGPVDVAHVVFLDTAQGYLSVRPGIESPTTGAWMAFKTGAPPKVLRGSAFLPYVVGKSDFPDHDWAVR